MIAARLMQSIIFARVPFEQIDKILMQILLHCFLELSELVRANWASSGRGVLVSAGNNQANSKRPLWDPKKAPKRFQLTPNGLGDLQLGPECFPKSIPGINKSTEKHVLE